MTSPPADLSPPLQLRLIGAPAWLRDGVAMPIGDPRVAVLVAMIALDGPVPRQRAADTFWPGGDARARTNLRVLLHRAQLALGARLFGGGERLTLLPHVELDLTGTDDEVVARCLQVGAAGAQLLDGIDLSDLPDASRWLSGARRQVEQRIVRGHMAWLDAHRGRDRLAEADAVAESLVAIDPLGEIGHRALMRVRAERGDRAGALAAFERCRRELKEHLGTSPDPQTAALHRAILRARDDRADAPEAPSRRPLLQREQELADMEKALAGGRIVLVEGPSGVGKSALLRQFARERGDFLWTAAPSDGAGPLAGLVRFVTHLGQLAAQAGHASRTASALAFLKDLQPLDPDDVDAATHHALAQGTAGVVDGLREGGHRAVVLDDVHLLDDASLDVLSQVLQSAWERMPWCGFVLAYRPMRARRKLRALCEKLALDGRLRLVHPGALRREAVQALMGQRGSSHGDAAATADRLLALSGGTPAVLVELIELDAVPAGEGPLPPLPPQVRSLLLERLRACSSTAEGLAQLASVAGASFTVGLAAAITGLSSWKVAEKWNELLLAGVFDARGFAFPLVEIAVRESVPDAVRQFMHGEVAKALEREDAPPHRLALHWRQAGDLARASRHARAAAAACLHAGQLDGAIDVLEPVVFSAAGTCNDADPLALLQLAAVYLQAHRLDRITEVLEAAARSPGTLLERGVCTALGGRTLLAMGEHLAAANALLSALPLVESDPALHRDIAAWAAHAANLAGTPAPHVPALPHPSPWHADGLPVHTPLDGARRLSA